MPENNPIKKEDPNVEIDTSGPEVSIATFGSSFFIGLLSGIVSSYVKTHARCPLDYQLLLTLHRRLADASLHPQF